ncbi:MAG TPA: acyltransferase, partial [Stellaceae bacterium]|nr:acyltransferase [Stellaceae bacterium]
IGMTLFFVLSGFVIHYNYHRTVPASRTGVLQFYIARFARLYPLFLIVFAHDFIRILWDGGYFSGLALKTYDPFKALPFYLTFTQTWWWWPLDGTSAYEYYATQTVGATGVMWSLSTEAFFYLLYPLFAGSLSRLRGRSLAVFAILSAAFGVAFYIGGQTNAPRLVNWALVHFPQARPEQFVHWLLFQSPWGRISEFLLGAAAAQVYLVGRPGDAANSEAARLAIGRWLPLASLVAFVLPLSLIVIFFMNIQGIATQFLAAPVAVFAYAVARYPTRLSRFLSHPLLVRLGDASYSLYLLHFFVLHEYGQRWEQDHPGVPRILVFLVLMVVAMALAVVSHRWIERPAIRWVRANFLRLKFEIWLPVTLALITVFSIFLSINIGALAGMDPTPIKGRIVVSSASFGDNCRSELHDNILGLMRRVCGNRTSCAFGYDVAKLQDPAGGCDKRFQVLYSCAPDTAEREFLIPHFDHAEMPIALSCK